MTDIINPETKTVRFWACGGTGIDLLRDYRNSSVNSDKNRNAYSQELDTYIDTSAANMHGINSNDTIYRVSNIEGGGKDRELVKKATIPVLPEILMKYPAGDLNVFLFSTSGGTGSAMGPLIMAHVAKAGHPVAAIVIDDHTSSASIANSINTMADLESIAQQLGRVIPIHYTKNDPTKTHLDNDANAKFVMGALSLLASGKNTKLDRADISNFFDYTKVTHHKAGIARLEVTTDREVVSKYTTVASFAAVLASELSTVPTVDMDYDAVGYFPEDAKGYDLDFFYLINPGMNSVIDEMIKSRDALEMKKRVTVQTSSLLGDKAGFNGNTGISI